MYFVNRKPLTNLEREQIIYSKSVPIKLHEALQLFSKTEINRIGLLDGVGLIKLDEIFCNQEVCLMGKLLEPYYFDKDHLTPSGALLSATLFTQTINE